MALYICGSPSPPNCTPRPGKDDDGKSAFTDPSYCGAGKRWFEIDETLLSNVAVVPDPAVAHHVLLRPTSDDELSDWQSHRNLPSAGSHPLTLEIINAFVRKDVNP